ncbi:MAG TPA: hypothetical protein PKA58_29090 [Polyangium sp.]|nr:hypothetical protein [Polyangium sp.]
MAITEDLVRTLAGGANRYEQLTNETYQAGSTSVLFNTMLPAAVRKAEGLLMTGFDNVARVRALMDTDENVQLNIARICLGMIGSTKIDMYDDKGNYPYKQFADLAEYELDALGRAQVQSSAQQDNPAVGQHDRTKSGNVNGPKKTPKLFNPECPGQYGKGGF